MKQKYQLLSLQHVLISVQKTCDTWPGEKIKFQTKSLKSFRRAVLSLDTRNSSK